MIGGSMAHPGAGRLQPGQTIAHYRLIEPLGAGGMGVAYKAEDVEPRRAQRRRAGLIALS